MMGMMPPRQVAESLQMLDELADLDYLLIEECHRQHANKPKTDQHRPNVSQDMLCKTRLPLVPEKKTNLPHVPTSRTLPESNMILGADRVERCNTPAST